MTFRFLCVGDLDVDMMASVERLPSADDKVAGRALGLTVGGMAANVAVGLRRLGAEVALAAAVGDDAQGAMAEQGMAREGVDLRYVVRRHGEPTFMCVVLLTPDGEKSLIRMETAAYLPCPEEIPDSAFAEADHVHLTYGCEALALSCATRARVSGASISLDLELADVPPEPGSLVVLLREVDWLFVNGTTRKHVERLLGRALGAYSRGVITTNGAAGARLDRGEISAAVAGRPVAVRDSTGAGDGFVAAFLHSRLVEGRSDTEALARANAAAAMVVQHLGAQTGLPTLDELNRYLADLETDQEKAHEERHA